LRLSPFDPQNFSWLFFLAVAYYFANEPEKGLSTARRTLTLRAQWVPPLKIAALCCASLGDVQQTHSILSEIQSSTDTGGDLARLIAQFNPTWADQMETTIHQAIDSKLE
jgi:adenylate cyclase